jgi:hypothetical protein
MAGGGEVMRRRALLAALALAPALASGAYSSGGAGTGGAAFLKVPLAVAPAGMAGAQTALGRGLDALEYNPAGLAESEGWTLAASHLSHLEGLALERLAVGYATPAGAGAFSLRLLRSPSLDGRDVNNTSTGAFTQNDAEAGFSLAKAFGPVSLGVQASYIHSALAGLQAQGLSGGLGAGFRQGDWRAGAAISNLGSLSALESQADGAPLSWRLAGAWTKGLGAFQVAAEAGIAQSADTALQLRPGLELGFQEMLFARAGWVSSPSYDGQQGLTAGGSLRYRSLSLDYAFAPFGDLGLTHRFGLSGSFGSSKARGASRRLAAPELGVEDSAEASTLRWLAVDGAQSYWVYLRRGQAKALERMGQAPVSRTELRVRGVQAAWDYSVAVTPVDSSGTEGALSQELRLQSAQAAAPLAPVLERIWLEGGELKLQWTAPQSPGPLQYHAKVSASSGSGYRSLGAPRRGSEAAFRVPKGAAKAYVVLSASVAPGGPEGPLSNEIEIDLP